LVTHLHEPVVELIEAGLPRSVIDMNRIQSRGVLPERARITAAIEKSPEVVLLDVHSFDGDAPWGEGCDVVFMDPSPVQHWVVVAAMHARNVSGIRVGVVKGSPANDIVMETKGGGVPAVLLEFREDVTDDQLSAVTKAVAAGIEYALNPWIT
jgi:hypothetical protein